MAKPLFSYARIAIPLVAMCLPLMPVAHAGSTDIAAHSGTVYLDDVPTLLGYAPSLSATISGLLAATVTVTPPSNQKGKSILWIIEESLAQADVRQRVDRAFSQNQPVLLVRGEVRETDSALIAGMFGASTDALLTLYTLTPKGIQAVALESLPEAKSEARAGLDLFMREARKHLDDSGLQPTARSAFTARGGPLQITPRAANGMTPDDQAALPRMELTLSKVGPKGNLISMQTELVRNVTATTQRLRVINKTTHALVPTRGTTYDRGKPAVSLVPYHYDVMHQLLGADSASVPTLIDWAPRATTSTRFDISETKSTQSGFNVSVSPEIGGSLAEFGVAPSAKLGGTYGYARTHTTENKLAYSVEDFFLKFAAVRMKDSEWMDHFYRPENSVPGDWTSQVAAFWTHQLADHLFNNRRLADPQNHTPNMHSFSPELLSIWEVPETDSRSLRMRAGSRISYHYAVDSNKLKNFVSGSELWTNADWSVDPTSPYLTREITVQIRSTAGNGTCLVDDGAAGQPVRMASCDRAPIESDRHAQWQLDNFNRYFNRGSGRCLTLSPIVNGSAQLTTQSCNRATNQVWQWQADRLHSLYDGGNAKLRLALDAQGEPVALGTASPRAADYPRNSENILMRPWSSYPDKPAKGDYIPTLTVGRRDIPDSWLSLPGAPSEQRWEVVVIRRASGS